MSTPIDVVAFAAYLNGALDYRRKDFPAKKLVDAIKGRPVNKWAYIPNARGPGFWRLEQATASKAMPWFVERAARFLAGRPDLQDAVFVPMPSSECVVGKPMKTELSTAAWIMATQCEDDARLAEPLRWAQRMKPAHEGGPRRAEDLYPHLRTTGSVPDDRPIVLVDDVYTSGGHVQAAAAELEEHGGTVVLAVVAARMVYSYPDEPFDDMEFDVERYIP